MPKVGNQRRSLAETRRTQSSSPQTPADIYRLALEISMAARSWDRNKQAYSLPNPHKPLVTMLRFVPRASPLISSDRSGEISLTEFPIFIDPMDLSDLREPRDKPFNSTQGHECGRMAQGLRQGLRLNSQELETGMMAKSKEILDP